ncbi:MAG: hypothetical protein IT572_02670 [Deltaproteobacteria bacterium]|nr:hypothetical protein [Deltaproteobacteria bacterium]
MRLILSWILAMSFFLPASLPAQQEVLFLKIITEVQRSSRPKVESPAEGSQEKSFLEDVWKEYPGPAAPDYEEGPADEEKGEEPENIEDVNL